MAIRLAQERMSVKHLTRWLGIATLVFLAATMVVFGIQKEGIERMPSQSSKDSDQTKSLLVDQHHRRNLQGLWEGIASVFATAERPNQTIDEDATHNYTIDTNSSTIDTNSSTIDNNSNVIDSNVSAVVPINFGPLKYVGHSGRWYARYPLGVCEGDCDSDGKAIVFEQQLWPRGSLSQHYHH
jgi:hypothetical protein